MANPHRRRVSPPIRGTVLDGIPEASPLQAASTSARRMVSLDPNDLPLSVRSITPGQNAFALRAAEVEAHRLRSNAFHQQATAAENVLRQETLDQEMATLELTPPTSVHPAYRENFRLGDTSPTSNLMAKQTAPSKAKSSLVNPGLTPPLKLIPEEGCQGNPTDRNFIEGFHEELDPKESSNETEPTPVFKYTPKLDSSEFSKSVGHNGPQKKKGGVPNWVTSGEQPSSPKKGIFEKLGLTSSRTSHSSNQTLSLGQKHGDHGGEAIPPKAKAVLSTNPQKASLGRSPSKRLGMFTRKASDVVLASDMTKSHLSFGTEHQKSTSTRQINTRHVNPHHKINSASVGSKTPAREQRPKQRRIASQPQPHLEQQDEHSKVSNEPDVSGVFRTKSLQYFDRMNPPTPPAKNTPPHEKKLKAEQDEADRILEAQKERSENQAAILNKMSQRNPVTAPNVTTPKREMQQIPESKLTSPLHRKIFEDDTPTRETVKLIGADDRTSPTKYGTYAYKNLPTIVKTPSVYSMKAGHFPDLEGEHSFEEVKKCADDLGLDGLRENPENYYKGGDLNVVRSPSIYEDDWSTKGGGLSTQASSDTLHFTGMFKPSPSMPDVLEHVRQLPSPALPKQARQLPTRIPTPTKKSPLTRVRTSSRSSSKGSIPLVYPGLASDPSRINLLEGLNIRRGSASDSRTHLPLHLRSNPDDPHRDSLTTLFQKSIEDLPQLSPDSFSHPSAKPSPLYSPSSPAFSPEVPSTPPRKGGDESADASPSPPKTLTPSRSRVRIETYKKSTGFPIARDADSFPVESQTLQLPSPQRKSLTPAISVTPPAASPAVFLNEPEKTGLVRYAAEKALIPLPPPIAPPGAILSDPQKVDNAMPSTAYDANNLLPNSDILDYTSYVARHRQSVYDPDGLLSKPITSQKKPLKKLPSWYTEVMGNPTDGKQPVKNDLSAFNIAQTSPEKKSQTLSPAQQQQQKQNQDPSAAEEEESSSSWRRLANTQQAQIEALRAQVVQISALRPQQDELAALRETVAALQKEAAEQQQSQQNQQHHTPTSASSSATTIAHHLTSTPLSSPAPAFGSLRSSGLHARQQQQQPLRESERVLRRRFEVSTASHAAAQFERDFVGEGESKEASLREVLVALGERIGRLEGRG